MPKAPPVAKFERQGPPDTELRRLEEENQALRNKVASQREETRVEQKNVERLRAEVAQLKAKLAATHPASSVPRAELDRLRSNHLEEVRGLRRKHQSEVDELGANHRREVAQLKREHHTALSEHERKASSQQKQALMDADQALKVSQQEIFELGKKAAEYEAQIAALRDAHGALVKRLDEAEQTAAAEKAAAEKTAVTASAFDDLTELKGVGPKVAQALRAAGITQFQQIANWTDADIEEIAPKIKTAAGRIRNGDWVGQAKRRAT